MIVLVLVALSLALVAYCFRRGRSSDDPRAGMALSGGVGAGLGSLWRIALDLGDAGSVAALASIALGVCATMGALHFGKRVRARATGAAQSPEIFE